jgi:energy-converting hydrogenase Eha subunit A
MKPHSDTKEEPTRGGLILSIAGIVVALGLSTLVLRLWGEHIIMRAILGLCWGGYALYSFGPDLIQFVREARNKNK